MLTFEEYIYSQLTQRGIGDRDIKEVIEIAKTTEFISDSFGSERWREEVSGYPEMTKVLLWAGVKNVALNWIDTNKPEAFYRVLFV